MRENVLGLTVVTAQRRGHPHRHAGAQVVSAGYDLTRLFVGSEGTLGVMTEITLQLYPLPEAMSAAVCPSRRSTPRCATTIQIIQIGVPIARCELLDANAVRAVNRHDKLGAARGADAADGVPRQRGRRRRAGRDGAGDRAASTAARTSSGRRTPEERTRLWTARHHAYFAGLQMKPGCRTVTTDTCVPISRLAECVDRDASAEAEAAGLPYYIVGHVGDGNFHVAYLVDPNMPDERETAERLNEQLVQRALRAGRHLHRRARHRPAQDGLPGRRGRRRRGRR